MLLNFDYLLIFFEKIIVGGKNAVYYVPAAHLPVYSNIAITCMFLAYYKSYFNSRTALRVVRK
jgi:hypothetical protein